VAGGRELCELAQPRIGAPNQTGSPDQDRIGIEVRVAASGQVVCFVKNDVTSRLDAT
jgi:hypothetical protein